MKARHLLSLLNNEQVNAYSEEGFSANQDGNSTPDDGLGSGSSENGTGGASGSESGSSSNEGGSSSENGSQNNQNGSMNEGGSSDNVENPGTATGNNGNSGNSAPNDEKGEANSSNDNNADNDGSKDPAGSENSGNSEEGEDQRDPFAWQSKLDACDLDAKLTVETSEIESLENNDLPSTLPATFRVDFNLNPGENKLLVGDWIETTLPNFLTFENATYEVFRLNEDGTETTEKIADAKTENGKLKITFVEAGATEDINAVVRGFVDLKATFSLALLGDDQELKQTWTAQTAEDRHGK